MHCTAVAAGPSASTQPESIATAFETALELLKNGSGTANPYDVVQSLYGEAQNILKAA
jgi:hypothetical protein